MGIIDVFYHGKLRDTVSLEDDLQAPLDFVENIKDKVFKDSSEFARISSKKTMMVAELRRWQNNLYSVFTYFIPGIDTAGRAGGYVAVTSIIHGALPSDRKKLFELFAILHKQLAKYDVVSEGQHIKADSFDAVKTELNSLSKEFSNAIREQCGAMKDISLVVLNKNEENTQQFNPIDINGDDFVKSLADAGKAYVSSQFPSKAEIKKKEEEHKAKQKEKEDKDRANDFADLKKQVLKVKEELKELKDTYGSGSGSSLAGPNNTSSDKRTKLWLRVLTALSLVNLILLCLLFFFVRANLKELSNDAETSPKTENVTNGQSTSEQTSNVAGTTVNNGQEDPTVNSQNENQQNDPNAVLNKLEEITQGIEGNTGNTEVQPKFGKTYDVSISVKCNKANLPKGNSVRVGDTLDFSVATPMEGHKFFVRGADFVGNNNKKAIVNGAEENVTVWYCHKEDEKLSGQCNIRVYPVQK